MFTRRRARATVCSVVDQPSTPAEQVFAVVVIAAMMTSGFLLIVL